MKILSIRQPWAWLIVNGYKDIENRTWNTKYRGHILIHASKTLDKFGLKHVKDTYVPRIPLPTEFEFGGIVGSAEIVDVIEPIEGLNVFSSWYNQSQYGLVLTERKVLPFEAMKGRLGLWTRKD